MRGCRPVTHCAEYEKGSFVKNTVRFKRKV
jgi:hypothetical protein